LIFFFFKTGFVFDIGVMSGFILDIKNTIAQVAAPINSELEINSNTRIKGQLSINNYNFPTTRSPGAGYILEDVNGNGDLQWVLPTFGGSGDPSYNFKRIIDSGTNYILGAEDYAIEIISNTYTRVTLPAAVGLGGRVYLISRGSDINIQLYAYPGDNIDSGIGTNDGNPYTFHRKYTRVVLMSNNINGWYTI
jgi:hypothetical protein